MNMNATKKPGLSLGRLSAVAQIAVQRPAQAPDAEIELSLIYSIKQVRKNFRNLEELAESFKLNGIIEPLIVHVETDGRYRLIIGERRFRAAPLASLTKVPVIIKRGLNELQIRRLQVAENNDRDNLTAYDEAMGVIEDVEQYGTKEAMLIWNRGEAWVSKRMAVKRYADPVRELLESELCGDFEVLHSLNQLHELSVVEYGHMERRMKDGLPLSRDEVRNKVASVKTWIKQETEMAKRRAEAQSAPKQEKPAEKTPKRPEEQYKKDAEAGNNAQGAAATATTETTAAAIGKTEQAYQPSVEPSLEEIAAAERERLECGLISLRKEVFEWGDANLSQFNSIKTKLIELGHDRNETEWVLWSGFLTMALPILHAVGDNNVLPYIKRLQTEFRSKTPLLMWRELHPLTQDADPENDGPRVEIPAMPADWRF